MPLSTLKNLTTQQKADWERYYQRFRTKYDEQTAARLAWTRFKRKYKRKKSGGGWQAR